MYVYNYGYIYIKSLGARFVRIGSHQGSLAFFRFKVRSHQGRVASKMVTAMMMMMMMMMMAMMMMMMAMMMMMMMAMMMMMMMVVMMPSPCFPANFRRECRVWVYHTRLIIS